MKTALITIKVHLTDDADMSDVANECDYNISHKDVIDTELVAITGNTELISIVGDEYEI